MTRRRCRLVILRLGLMLGFLPGTRASGQSAARDTVRASHVDFVIDHHRVTGGYGDWQGVALRLVAPTASRRTVWFGEGLWRRAFGDEGIYLSAGVQQVLSREWYMHLSAGSGSGEFVLPDARVDVSLARKWLSGQQLVTTAGMTLVDAKRGYRDQGEFLAVTAYPTATLVVEAGGRLNRSTPGDVTSSRTFGALTLGTDRRRYVVVRGSSGTEGYQLVGPTTAITKFTSHEGSAAWREWFGSSWGGFLQGERYTNPIYRRTGVTLGLFVHW